MPTIHINVKNRVATVNGDDRIINGNSDYSIEFDFDAEWTDLNNKIGIFAYNDAAAHKWAYQPVMFSGNTCTVPILRDIHCVYVGVTAGNVRVTTPATVQCRLSISDYADTEEPPSADIWGQILAKLDELQTEIDEIKAGGVGGTDISLNVTGATVGQTIKVKAVDANGKPTAWEAVDMAAGDTEVWEKVCQVTTTEDVSFIYQPFGGYYKKIRATFLGESTAACQAWVYPNTETRPGAADRVYIFNAPYAAAGQYIIVGEFSIEPYPSPDDAKYRYLGKNCVQRKILPGSVHSSEIHENYIDDAYAKDLAQGVKSLYWTHNAGEIKAGAQMVVYGVKA